MTAALSLDEATLPELADAIETHTGALRELRAAQRTRIVERITAGDTWSKVQADARVSRATIMAALRDARGVPASS